MRTSNSGSSFRRGRAIVRDGHDQFEGLVELAGRNTTIVGHVRRVVYYDGTLEHVELGRPVSRTWAGKSVVIDWLDDEPAAS